MCRGGVVGRLIELAVFHGIARVEAMDDGQIRAHLTETGRATFILWNDLATPA